MHVMTVTGVRNERKPGALKCQRVREGAGVTDRGEQSDSIPIYREQVMKEGFLINVF